MKKSIKKFLPYVLITVLLMAVTVFLVSISNKNNPANKPVVDMSLPIEKILDETNKITEVYAGGTREKIQVKFTWKAGGMSFTDAVYFLPEEFAKLTSAEIEQIKMERMTNWANAVNTASRQR